MKNRENTGQKLKNTLKKYWDYDDFRPPQAQIIQAILNQQDCLIVMPTGGGKSLCFQLPALLQTGLTIVVSPLIALMENQVRELQQRNIAALILHSQISKYQKKSTLQQLKSPSTNPKILYLAPETLLSRSVWEIITNPELVISALIIDEAHCLTQWGNSFRPAYLRLGTIRASLVNNNQFRDNLSRVRRKFPIACFTATADKNTQIVIKKTLKLNNPQIFLASPYRPNLQIKINTIWTPKGRKNQLINFLQAHQNQSGLVYIRSRQEAESLAKFITNLGYPTYAYHGGLNANLRRKIETDWLEEKIRFVICTSAFGMGINKANLRWVFHYQAPLLLSEYIQEIGRGGRDGKATEVVTLISEPTGLLNPEDQQKRNFFTNQLINKYQRAKLIVKQLPNEANILDLSQKINNPDLMLYLAILSSCQQLKWFDPFTYQLTINNLNQSINNLIKKQQKLVKQTQQYFTTKTCRWNFLLTEFNFPLNSNFRCGHCDNCQ